MKWWMFSLISSVVWGFHYTMLETSMKSISQTTAYILSCIPALFVAFFFREQLAYDFDVFMAADIKTKLPMIIIMFTSFTATMCLFFAMSMKSATYAALIEISYPIFVTLFTLLILGVNHFSWSVVVGALMIFGGSTLVIINN